MKPPNYSFSEGSRPFSLSFYSISLHEVIHRSPDHGPDLLSSEKRWDCWWDCLRNHRFRKSFCSDLRLIVQQLGLHLFLAPALW
ncbi:hypothetical protein K737_300331 [Holospora undulata HU1]|uniref:Uncharacterized protein n=1 Tax=Holospora undulata HU1 TaxID=1321371 RepID=A0A061JIV7_9PROT|nr:hypothetical protein K737_300331 [Holospora undulata HU1]